MVKALKIIYEPSDSIVAQGKNVSKQERRGYRKVQGGNGTFRIAKPSKVTLIYEVDGKRMSSSVRSLICDAYSISRISEKQADRFLADIQSGAINLDYSDISGLIIV